MDGLHSVMLTAREECERLLSIITSKIPSSRIVEYPELRERVYRVLKNMGYSKASPPCELRIIEQSESIFRYGVFLVEGFQMRPLLEYSIRSAGVESVDAILEEIMAGLNEGEASVYNIRNFERFTEQFSSWLREHI
jgi:hypothetical protein